MKKFTKNYIGKGTAVAGMDIVKVNLPYENLKQFTHEFQGVLYISFEIAKMQSKDDYGRTHTCYVSVHEASEEKVEAEQQKAAAKVAKKAAKKIKKAEMVEETADQEIPF